MSKAVLFQTSQFSISTQFYYKTVLFQAIQFSIRRLFCFIWPIDKTISSVTTPEQNGPGSDGNEAVIHMIY